MIADKFEVTYFKSNVLHILKASALIIFIVLKSAIQHKRIHHDRVNVLNLTLISEVQGI